MGINGKKTLKTTRLHKIPPRFQNKIEEQIKGISLAIQKKRETLGLTQEELAEKLDVAVMTIQFIEQGRRYPSLIMLIYICEVLDLPLIKIPHP